MARAEGCGDQVANCQRLACLETAELYSNGVIALGSVFYAEAQSKACQCCP
jgi:hypothetical protein